MISTLPPPVFKYDVANYQDLCSKAHKWEGYKQLPAIDVKDVIIKQDVFPLLTGQLAKYGKTCGRVLVLMDDTVMYRQGVSLKPQVTSLLAHCNYDVCELVLKGDDFGIVHADFNQVQLVIDALTEDTAVVIIGTGVVTDIGKHACFLFAKQQKCPPILLISCMTACTVPAYTSQYSIIDKDGVKRTYVSRTPDCILVDLQTLIDAPKDITLGGIGDTFPVFCAFADWYFAEVFGYSPIVDASWRIYDDIRELLFPHIKEIAGHSCEGMEILAKCIHNVGLSMTYAGDTAPASGFEHVISHMLDMAAKKDNRKVGLHGQQVGVSVLLTLIHIEKLIEEMDRLYERIHQINIKHKDEQTIKKEVTDAFIELGKAQAEECLADYMQKWGHWVKDKDRLQNFIKDWHIHKANLSIFMPYTAKQCAQALKTAGHPITLKELSVPISKERGYWAVLHANKMRKRFTSADLVYFLGWLNEDWVEDIFKRLEEIA